MKKNSIIVILGLVSGKLLEILPWLALMGDN